MTTKATAQAVDITMTPMRRFERELEAKHPNRLITRFDMPPQVKQCAAVYIKEITSREELEASKMADAMMSDVERKSAMLSTDAQRRECIRMSIVGLASREPTTYRHIGGDFPFMEMDGWPAKAGTALALYFNTVNGIPTDELLGGLKGARQISAADSPTDETPRTPSTEK